MMVERVRIDRMLYGGSGVAHSGSGELQIPFVLPGELVDTGPLRQVQIVEPASDRAAPRCVHFGECGGCHYQHAAYPAQLKFKRQILRDALAAAGLSEMPEIATLSAEPWAYRNRIRLRVGEAGGELRLGYNHRAAPGSETMLPIVMCPIAVPLLWTAAQTLVDRAKTEAAISLWMKAASEVELFTNVDEAKLQMTLFIRQPPRTGFNACCAALQSAIPELVGAGVAILPLKPSPRGRRFEHAKPGLQWGAPGLMYPVDGENFWVSRGSFFQVNRFLVAELARLATADRGGALAWDLYAGVGLFTRALIKTFTQVVAVEASALAAADLAGALKGTRHRLTAGTTLDFLQAAVVQRERPELILMDPPRAGVGVEACVLLGRIRPPELVYVSCDPITLGRDLKQLTDSGYKVRSLHMVDMFPQTFHQETVVALVRS